MNILTPAVLVWADDALERQEAAGGKSPMKRFKQTTLTTSVTPRAEGPRGGRLDVTPIAELERQVSGKTRELERRRSSEDVPASSSTMRQSGDKSSSSARTLTSGGGDDIEDLFGSDIDADDADIDAAGPSKASAAAAAGGVAAQQATPSTGSKRKRVSFHIESEEEDADYGSWDSTELGQLFALTDSVAQSAGAKTRDAFVTPVAQRTTDMVDGMPTPSLTGTLTDKPLRRNLFNTPSAEETQPNSGKRPRLDEPGAPANNPEPASSHSLTPFSSSSTPGATPTRTPRSGPEVTDVAEDVMALLEGQGVEAPVLREVRHVLEKHVAVARGLQRGRDASREAAKEARARSAQLQQRVADLENRRKLDAEARMKIKGGLMNLYIEN